MSKYIISALVCINENILKEIKGHIGNLQVTVIDEDEEIVLNVSQIVWFDAKQPKKERIGIFDANLSSVDEVIKTLKAKKTDVSMEHQKFIAF